MRRLFPPRCLSSHDLSLLRLDVNHSRRLVDVLSRGHIKARPLWLWSRCDNRHHDTSGSIYRPLSRYEIRVLRIRPGAEDADICCDLEIVSMKWRPSYDTLSYTWGNSKTTLPITLNGTAVQISPNLFIALKAIRGSRRTVTLWADALCIDQSSLHEKNSQVAMMDLIYKRGRQTWISLGSPKKDWANGAWTPGPRIDESMHNIKRLVRGTWRLLWHHVVLRRSRASRLGVNHVSDSVRLLKSLEAKGELSDQNIDDRNIAQSMLAWLITHHYWERVWILQEIALSGKDPICIFGNHQVPLLSLDTAIRDWRGGWDGKDSSRNVVQGWLPEFTRGFDRIVEVCLLRDEHRRKKQLGLARCLNLTSHRYTSLAHDHVYGLYGLLTSHVQRSPPDYSLPICQLYSLITKDIIFERRTADVLCVSVGIGRMNQHDLPSWALDFSAAVMFPAKSDAESCPHDFDQAGDACADTLSLPGRAFNDQVIAVMDRKLIDRATFEKFGLANANSGRQSAPKHIIQDTVSQCYRVAVEAGLQPDFKVLMHVLTSKVYEEHTDQRFERQQEDALLQNFSSTVVGVQSSTATGGVQQIPLAMFQVMSSFFAQEIGLSARNHNFFCTRDGRIGKCAGEVVVGDEIWLLSSSKTPFLLRRADEAPDDSSLEQSRIRYRLVGPCKSSDHPTDTGIEQGEIRQIELV
ncbi:hypothetical protein DOTSEDRAFT_81675 [Dothistroma septosporum NZE10]|uniref:Heterokaryon incompatibility domain-containing protein n=1 Tax=Dothistroma septosporum (strain NZE10 / CBS 128990) TaxID=675120 RepID=N1PFD4_DOTSN|nr:hypothetical protein DOTSEDRAFT_81675 [Dothistroma septosporum NZE10]